MIISRENNIDYMYRRLLASTIRVANGADPADFTRGGGGGGWHGDLADA